MTIQPGEWQWFAFKYSYDRSRNSDDDKSNDQVPANLRLDAEPANGVSLLLVNKDQVQAWQSGEKLQGFGAATPQTDKVQNKSDLDRFCHDYPNDPVCTGGDRSQSACENIVAGAAQPRTVQVPDLGVARLLQLEGHHRRHRHLLHRRQGRPTCRRPHPLQIHLHRRRPHPEITLP